MSKVSQHILYAMRVSVAMILCAFALASVLTHVDSAYAVDKTQLASTVTSATLSTGNFSTWLSEPTTVTLNAPSWATTTKYHFGVGSFENYVRPLSINTEGKTTLYFQSSSTESIEPLQTAEVWLDFTAPTQPGDIVFSQPEPDGFSYSFGPSEDNLSGIASYEVTVTSEATSSTVATQTISSTSNRASELAPGTYDISYAAKDFAGNISKSQKHKVMVGLAKPVLCYEIDDREYAEKIEQGAWITTGVDVRLTASITSEAPTTTLKLQTMAGSLETTEVARDRYVSVPLTIGEQGEGNVVLSATDVYGNNSEETSFTLKVDRIAPSAPTLVRAITSKSISDSTKTNLNMYWGKSFDAASGVGFYRVTIERMGAGFAGTSVINTKKLSAVLTNVKQGDYLVTVQAFDNAGLSSEEAHIAKSVAVADGTYSPSTSSRAGETTTEDQESSSNTNQNGSGHSVPPADDTNNKADGESTDEETATASAFVGGTLAGPKEGNEQYAQSVNAPYPKKQLTLGQKLLEFLRYEWLIWVPGLLALIAATVIIGAALRRNRKPDAADGLSQTREPGPLSSEDDYLNVGSATRATTETSAVAGPKETAQPLSEPSSQLSDQAGQYFTINS